MAVRKLTFEQAKNMPCSIPHSVFADDANYEGLRNLLEEDGVIPSSKKVQSSSTLVTGKDELTPELKQYAEEVAEAILEGQSVPEPCQNLTNREHICLKKK